MKYLLMVLLALCTAGIQAQEKPVIRKGLISAQATISPAHMFGDGESYFYLHGGLEGYVSDEISLTGEGFYQLGSFAKTNAFDHNHSLFFGASKHFTKNSNDLYIGLQPGVSFTRLNAAANGLTRSGLGVNPLVSPVVGYNFFVNKVFHFFVQARLVLGQHNYDVHQNISEFRFSAGLGFNLNTMR